MNKNKTFCISKDRYEYKQIKYDSLNLDSPFDSTELDELHKFLGTSLLNHKALQLGIANQIVIIDMEGDDVGILENDFIIKYCDEDFIVVHQDEWVKDWESINS